MTRYLVVDASLVVKAMLPGQDQEICRQVLDGWRESQVQLCAPTLYAYEIMSALTKIVHFGEVAPAEGRRMLRDIWSLPVELMSPGVDQTQLAYAWTLELQRNAAYDSFYLALAQELGCELWTTDRRLCAAAKVPWVRSPFD